MTVLALIRCHSFDIFIVLKEGSENEFFGLLWVLLLSRLIPSRYSLIPIFSFYLGIDLLGTFMYPLIKH